MTPVSSSEEAQAACGLEHKLLLNADPTAPLVVLVHGRAGDSSVMWAFRRAFPDTCSFIAPQAFLADEVGGWSWWNVRTEGGANREAVHEAADRLERFTSAAIYFYQLSPRKVVAVGFSQGAGLLSILVQRRPQFFAGVALLAGFVMEENHPLLSPSLPPIYVAHGDKDEVVTPQVCKKGVDYLRGRGFSVDLVFDAVGHKIGPQGVRGLTEWTSRIVSGQ